MPFKKGQSGNPGGRPKLAHDVQALARAHTTAAIEALVRAMADPKTAVAAAVALLDRGYGKPIQPTTNETSVTVNERSPAERRAIAEKEAAEMLERVRKNAARTVGVTLQ